MLRIKLRISASLAIARPAIAHHAASLNYLRKTQVSPVADPRGNIHRGSTFEEWQQEVMAIAGSPATVCAALEAQARELGINYLLSYLFFGAMTLEQALASLELCAKFCRLLREAVGSKADLLFGTHGQFTASGAIRLAKRLEPYEPLWFEEPTPPEMPEEMAKVARATSIPPIGIAPSW